jgi:hypothetical protein
MAILKRLKKSIKTPLLFGVSIYPDDSVDKEELVNKAELDLRTGRNPIEPKGLVCENRM